MTAQEKHTVTVENVRDKRYGEKVGVDRYVGVLSVCDFKVMRPARL